MRKIMMMFIAAMSVMIAKQADAAVVNVAPFGTATQSTTATNPSFNFGAEMAINGLKTGQSSDITHTLSSDTNPTWTLDLGQIQPIESIDIYNRTDCCSGRLRDITVDILAANGTTVLYTSGLLNPGNVLGGGIGDYANGPANPFTITPGGVTNGQFVRINRTVEGNANDDQAVLVLSEVEVFAEFTPPVVPVNLALNQPATQSTTNGGFVAGLATNGNTGDFTHTLGSATNPFWQVDLGGSASIDDIVLFNRGGGCCQERLRDITVQILDDDLNPVFTSVVLNPGNSLNGPPTIALDIAALNGSAVIGSFVRVSRASDTVGPTDDDKNVLSLGEVRVFGAAVPEPSSIVLFGFALLGLCAFGLTQRRRKLAVQKISHP